MEMYGEEISIEYSGTIAFGMPEDKVEDDSRFEMDKEDAEISDIEDLFGTYMLGGMGLDNVRYRVGRYRMGRCRLGYGACGGSGAPVESSAYSGDIVLGVVMPTFDTAYSQILLNLDFVSESRRITAGT